MRDQMMRQLVLGATAIFAAGTVFVITVRYMKRNRKNAYTKKAVTTQEKFNVLQLSKIVLVQSEDDWHQVAPLVLDDVKIIKALGFDAEWWTEYKQVHPVSLVQLATFTGLCVLIRMNKMTTLPESLRKLLEDKSILKLGVGCENDSKKLFRDHDIIVKGCLDLRNLALRVRSLQDNFRGLSGLCGVVTGVFLDKDIHVRLSNWQAETLSKQQIDYAAMDGLAGIRIFLGLIKKRLGLDLCEEVNPESWNRAMGVCQGITDRDFKQRQQASSSRHRNKSPQKVINDNEVSSAYSARQKPLYHNCQLRAPDGQLLCTCDIKKAEWYIEKGLGEKISDDPLTIKLKFEPSGRPLSERNYYLQEKSNVCVVCGRGDSYIRKNIVPQEYRKHFPSIMKDHRSHDIVLMCTACHQSSSNYDSNFKMNLIRKYNISEDSTARFTTDIKVQQVVSAARALLRSSEKLPLSRKTELEDILKKFYRIEEIDSHILESSSELDPRVYNSQYVSHGEVMIQAVIEGEGLMSFERAWRQHFIDTMKPAFLPELWSVDHSHDRLTELNQSMQQTIDNVQKDT